MESYDEAQISIVSEPKSEKYYSNKSKNLEMYNTL